MAYPEWIIVLMLCDFLYGIYPLFISCDAIANPKMKIAIHTRAKSPKM